MSKITRVTQSIFAGAGDTCGQFGSALAGTKVITQDIATLQALSAYSIGWPDALISPETLPPFEESQALDYIETYQICYLLQEGIAEYDAGTTYYTNSIVKQSGTYNLYGSVIDDNTGNSLTDITKWTFLRNLQAEIAVSMGFESSPSGRKLIFNGQTVAKSSGGTANGTQYIRAYEYLWNNINNTYAPVSGGRGMSADADFAANKNITLPDFTNMSPMQVGSIVNSAGKNDIGNQTVASEGTNGNTGAHALTIAELPIVTPTIKVHSGAPNTNTVNVSLSFGNSPVSAITDTRAPDTTSAPLIDSFGSGSTHLHTGSAFVGSATSVVHPVFGLYYYINY